VGQFGEALRRERLSRGIALETISEKTKVVSRYLTALEDEHFEQLPGGILSKGIVRGYARTLGLDEATWVERFMAESRERGLSPAETAWIEFVENVGRSRPHGFRQRSPRLRWASIGILLALLCGLGFFVWHYVGTHVQAQEQQQAPVTSAAVSSPGQ
jgi:cytoskeletal protein RodZ